MSQLTSCLDISTEASKKSVLEVGETFTSIMNTNLLKKTAGVFHIPWFIGGEMGSPWHGGMC